MAGPRAEPELHRCVRGNPHLDCVAGEARTQRRAARANGCCPDHRRQVVAHVDGDGRGPEEHGSQVPPSIVVYLCQLLPQAVRSPSAERVQPVIETGDDTRVGGEHAAQGNPPETRLDG